MEEQKFFKILWEGDRFPHLVKMAVTNNSLHRTKESEEWIEREWQRKLAGGFKPWPNDLKPTRFRFCGAHEKDGNLIVTVDPCVSYRDFVGSCSPEFLKQFGEEFNPHPLAVSVIIVTQDKDGQRIMLTVRKKVDYKVGGYHASIGGFLEIGKDADIVSALYREVKEECGVEANEIEDLRCISVAYNLLTAHTDIIFVAFVNIESREIQKRKRDDENENLFFISATRKSIEELLVKTVHANVVIATVGLILLGRDHTTEQSAETSQEWYRRMLAFLANESRNYDSHNVREELEKRDITRFQEMIRNGGWSVG